MDRFAVTALPASKVKASLSKRKVKKTARRFDRLFERSHGLFVDRYGEETALLIRRETADEYRRILPEIPYIGGRRNIYSTNLVQTAWALAIHRVVSEHGGNVEDAGELIHGIAKMEMERVPQVVRHLSGRLWFSRMMRLRLQRAARRSKARRYAGDFRFEWVPGHGKSVEFGIDMIECGIVTFLRRKGAEELGPYLCDLDYLMFGAMGIGLRRTKTLAWGCDRCDFRFSRDGVAPASWPPGFVERTCGEQVTETQWGRSSG